MDERHGCGEDSPGDHDDGNPASRAEAQKDKVGGDFEDGVADEEEPGASTVDGTGKAKVTAHGQCGEAEVDAVKVGADVEQEKKWDKPPEDAAHDASWVDFGHTGCGLIGMRHAAFDTTGAGRSWEVAHCGFSLALRYGRDGQVLVES